MLTKINLILTVILICAAYAVAQEDGEQRLRRALEGRQVLLKMDMPAIDTGVVMIFDDTKITFDDAAYSRMLKEYGPSIKKGTKARITGVRLAKGGVELDLDGGGSPSRDWLVGNF